MIDIIQRLCNTIHMASNRRGKAKLREYGAWADMIQRCRNPKLKNYYLYGGRGIKVCERWQLFDNFYTDMGSKPDGYSLERIDNNGNYEPQNCKWASPTEQSFNRRTSHMLTFMGKSMPMTMWARERNINPITVSGRLRRGWSVERTLTTYPSGKGA